MESLDLVSFIIPVFNAETFLLELIESIKKQTYPNWEALFVDDGSEDGSRELLKIESEKDSRIKLIVRDRLPKGAPTCRNIGIEESRGKYVIFLDADDIIADFCLQQRIDGIKKYDTDFCVFSLTGFNKVVNDLDNPPYLGFPTRKHPLHYLIQKLLPFVVVTNIYKKGALSEKGIKWDENVTSLQDSDFNIECLYKGLSFKILHECPDYYWRLDGNNGSITKQINTTKHFTSHLYLFEKQSRYFMQSALYEKDLDAFVFFLLFKFILANNKKTIDLFLESAFFQSRRFYAKKIKLLSFLMIDVIRINQSKLFSLLYLLLFPCRYYFIRSERESFISDRKKAIKKLSIIDRY